MTSKEKYKLFQNTIWAYYKKAKREMPWRETEDPYKILVSEIMLQQTQVERVLPKYLAFIKKFPDFQSLASGQVGDVLTLWQGLGYNRRALFLKRSAEEVVLKYKGIFPKDISLADELPGIGEATAGAILAYSYNLPTVFIETNIRRVFIHFFFPNKRKVKDIQIVDLVRETLDRKNPKDWYYALMDYGAMLKSQVLNPNRRSAHYSRQSKFEGSSRQIRGNILKLMLKKQALSEKELLSELKKDSRTKKAISQLISEGFLKKKDDLISIS